MRFDYCVIGGSGAIGAAIANLLSSRGRVCVLNSQNCNLLNSQFNEPLFMAEVVINAAGTFGGLRQYEARTQVSESSFLLNLIRLIEALNPKYVVNVSSAALSDKKNFSAESLYYHYVIEKSKIESELDVIFQDCVAHLRCTNIISKYENYLRSGHSIASIYRKFLTSKTNIEIWSNEHDWREYIDADDIAMVVAEMIDSKMHGTYTVGSGNKSYIKEIVNAFAVELKYIGDISYTQPNKPGPLSMLVGVPQEFQSLAGRDFPTELTESIKKCIVNWG